MFENIITILILAIGEIFAINMLIKFSKSKNLLLDIPNSRSSHRYAVPKVGGIAIFLLLASSGFLIYPEFLTNHIISVLAIFFVFIIGVIDDLLDLSPYPKFLVMILSSLMVIYDGYTISSLGTYFGVATTLGFLTIPFTVFAIVGFTNAMNLIDGLDGLSGSVSAVILSGFIYIGYIENDIIV
ncbi:MAG: undecaprenyl/decaprenyl-phosphate alpha-N-acetylglucosaminyl 1-phosphate transferase, partial [Campylobacterales bacterium]|nr:undecaprenyl/decaprenyl-phosphate alpha-N-acetylglucosaminyl 1-phosphate transferase [Campylobacterales bacterium]